MANTPLSASSSRLRRSSATRGLSGDGPDPAGRRGRPAAGRNASTTPATTTTPAASRARNSSSRRRSAMRKLPHRQHRPEGAVGRRHDGLREPANREGLVGDVGGPDRRRAGPAARGQVAAAGRERAVSRDEDHRRPRGEPVQERRRVPRRAGRPPPCRGRPAGTRAVGALHRRGDQEVRVAAGQPQGQDRLARGRRAREARRRARRNLHQGSATGVTDRDEVGEPVAGDRQHARGGAAGEDRPVALDRSLDHRGVAGEEDRLAPQRFLIVGDERVDRVHGPGDRGVAGANELTVGRDEPEPGQDPQRDRQQQEGDEEGPEKTAHNLFSVRTAANYTGFRSRAPGRPA